MQVRITESKALVTDLLRSNGYDGLVLDTGYLGLRMQDEQQELQLLEFLKRLSS